MAKEINFQKEKLLENYMIKMLYKCNDGKFENKYLRKLEKNQERQKEKDKMRRKSKFL